jgi:hypothetical protein
MTVTGTAVVGDEEPRDTLPFLNASGLVASACPFRVYANDARATRLQTSPTPPLPRNRLDQDDDNKDEG